MKKALFVSLLSTVALLSARAQAQVLCTLGARRRPTNPWRTCPRARPRKRI